jgi:AcrR family transcriptional regulator
LAPRTQRERREATIGKLLDATITTLIEHGYRDTTIGRICDHAGVSHGGLFRHFSSRTALLAAAADEIGRRHLETLRSLVVTPPKGVDPLDALVTFFREATREPLSAAWREVIVAARADAELREAVTPAVLYFENTIMEIAAKFPGAPKDTRKFGTLILSLLHMFDSEATTTVMFVTEDIEKMRHEWAVSILREALE